MISNLYSPGIPAVCERVRAMSLCHASSHSRRNGACHIVIYTNSAYTKASLTCSRWGPCGWRTLYLVWLCTFTPL